MSDEIKVLIDFSFSKNGIYLPLTYSKKITVTGNVIYENVQTIGTTEEEIAIPADMATIGIVIIINRDTTNFVRLGTATGVYPIRMNAGEACFFRRNSGITPMKLYGIADTASCDCQIILAED